MNASSVDDVVKQLTSNPVWCDWNDIVELVLSIAGSRNNCADLTGLITKLSETENFSGIFEAVRSFQKLLWSRLVDRHLEPGKPDRGSALEVFELRWAATRPDAEHVDIDPMAAAILAGDVPKLGELIAGAKAAKIEIARKSLPVGLVRRPSDSAGLLDIAAAVGGGPLRYLLEFFGLKPTVDTLLEAVATGNPDTIRTIWDRLPSAVRASGLREAALVAADFHHIEVLNWLLIDARRSVHFAVRRLATNRLLFDVFLRLPVLGPSERFVAGTIADEMEDEVNEVAGGAFKSAELLLAKRGGWEMSEFSDAAAGVAPVLVLIETELGVRGGFAAVPFQGSVPVNDVGGFDDPFPLDDVFEFEDSPSGEFVADPSGTSYVFSLLPGVERHSLKDKSRALWRRAGRPNHEGFGFGTCLRVAVNDGKAFMTDDTRGDSTYDVHFPWGYPAEVKVVRLEVWRVALGP